MRITIVIAGLGGGGAERVCVNLANAWVDRGYKPTILTISQNSRPPAYAIACNRLRGNRCTSCDVTLLATRARSPLSPRRDATAIANPLLPPSVFIPVKTTSRRRVVTLSRLSAEKRPEWLLLVRHGIDGLIVTENSVAALAAALERLMSDETERNSFASRAPEVIDRFSLEAALTQWDELLSLSHTQ